MNEIAIVIPIYNEAATLPQLIAALAAQTLTPKEILFVDSGSTDGSQALVESYATSAASSVRVIANPGGMPGGNRNVGVQAARSEWIAFLDAGIVPEPTWLEHLWRCATARGLQAVYGVCHFDAEAPFQKAVCAISYGCGATHPVLPAALFHRSVFDTIGWFRADLRAAEDLLWLRDLQQALGPRQVCADARVEYRHFPPNAASLARKWWSYEHSVIRSGILSAKARWLSVGPLPAALLALVYAPLPALALLAALVTLRGVASPIQRSGSWRWWAGCPAALPLAVLACFIRDMAKILARCLHGVGPWR